MALSNNPNHAIWDERKKKLVEEAGLVQVKIGQNDFEQRRRYHMGHGIISGNSHGASVVRLFENEQPFLYR